MSVASISVDCKATKAFTDTFDQLGKLPFMGTVSGVVRIALSTLIMVVSMVAFPVLLLMGDEKSPSLSLSTFFWGAENFTKGLFNLVPLLSFTEAYSKLSPTVIRA